MREDGTYFGKDSWSDFKPGWLIEFCEKKPEAGPKVWIRMSLSVLALFFLATSLHMLFDLIRNSSASPIRSRYGSYCG